MQNKLAHKQSYQVIVGEQPCIKGRKLQLPELEAKNLYALKIYVKPSKQALQEGWEEIKRIPSHKELLNISEITQTELTCIYHDDSFAGYFGIEKTQELIAQKYDWLILKANMQSYVKDCNLCLVLKSVKHKSYGNLQSLSVSTYR